MVSLNHTELATGEDKTFITDLWAQTFKSENQEEINMLAQQNEYIKEAVSGMKELLADENIRQRCQEREDYAYWQRIRVDMHKQELEKQERVLAERDEALANLAEKERQHQQELIEKDQEIADLKARLAALESSSRQN